MRLAVAVLLACALGVASAGGAGVRGSKGFKKVSRGTPKASREQVAAMKANYPRMFPLKRILTRWNPDIVDVPPDGGLLFDSLERLDFGDPVQRARAMELRDLQLPFKVHNVPNLNEVVERWKDTKEMAQRFGSTGYTATASHANHLMFYRGKGPGGMAGREEWNAEAAEGAGDLGHEADDNIQPSKKAATKAAEEAAAREKGYTYRHPPPTKTPMTYSGWVENNVEIRSRIQQVAQDITAVGAKTGVTPGTIAEAAAALPEHKLRHYFGAALALLHRTHGVTAGAQAGEGGGQWPWWWWPVNATDANAAQWFPRAYLEFGDDHDSGRAPPGQDIHIFRSKADTPEADLFLVDRTDIRGLHCRFGTSGTIAEGHWDGHLNFVAILGGAKRYILTPPSECKFLAIMESGPSERHVGYDGSDLRSLYTPGLASYDDYAAGRGLETIVHEGEALYLPSYWIHWIVSLTDNYQCNCRSGTSPTPVEDQEDLGLCLSDPEARDPDWKLRERWWESPQSWHGEEEAAALEEIRTVYAPALLAAARGEAITATPPPPATNTYMAAEAALEATLAAHPERRAPTTLPQVARNAEEVRDEWVRSPFTGAPLPLTTSSAGGLAVALVGVGGLLAMVVLRRSRAVPRQG